ncbi:hypothetical protein [uncultured Draconibacterium sp.]|uniref:hypothetical protein n=1 Tax=uncultured Draconibacterium sp. TaxID=1573823 RepID=UPI003217F350
MKTTKLRLFATMITLVAVTIATIIPAQAQRRSTQESTTKREPERNRNTKSRVTEKSTFKDYDKVRRTNVDSNLKSTRTNNRSSNQAKAKSTNNSNRSVSTNNGQNNRKAQEASRSSSYRFDDARKNNNSARNSGAERNNRQPQKVYTSNRSNNSDVNRSTNHSNGNRTYSAKKPESPAVHSNTRRTTGTNTTNNRNYYRVDKSDKRYAPNSSYKGSSRYWTKNYRPEKMNYNHKDRNYYSHYNYNNYSHWDRRWERYRWNHSSWRDYYYGYNPRSYVYHKNYYYHNHYGHVIQRFDYSPQVFVHNHHNYYCYNGHFFRYRMGVGYVLVDLPFGFEFDYMPRGYERVYINGYMYFRLGNLFFEWGNHGFSLVHYPERYYAYNDGYIGEGYHFNDDFYYDNY